MKYLYLKWNNESYWFELGEDNYVIRQIVLDENEDFHVSCLEDCLAEGPINKADLEGHIFDITKETFEDVWQSVLKKHEKQWEAIKKKYPIGTYIHGINSYLYPQGTVVKGMDFIAIYIGNDSFCIDKLSHYKIISYDNINMWLIVE